MVERRHTHLAIGGLMLAVGVVLAIVVDPRGVADVRELIVVVGAFLVGVSYLLAGTLPNRTVGPSPLEPELFVGVALLIAGGATAAGVSWVLAMQPGFGPGGSVPTLVGIACALPLVGGGAVYLFRSVQPDESDSGDAAT